MIKESVISVILIAKLATDTLNLNVIAVKDSIICGINVLTIANKLVREAYILGVLVIGTDNL